MSKEKDLSMSVLSSDNTVMKGESTDNVNVSFNQFLEQLIESKQLPSHIKTINDAFTVAQMGRELGFPTMQAMHYIIPISGKLSLSSKAIGALLTRGGVTYTVKEDALYIYKDESSSKYPKGGTERPVDRRTTIIFTRNNREETVSFGWIDAVSMGLSTKDNWVKMPRQMLFARCLSEGANRIAPDLLLGLYSTDELFDSFDKGGSIKVKREEDGTISEIIN